jgi:hypothetical protein
MMSECEETISHDEVTTAARCKGVAPHLNSKDVVGRKPSLQWQRTP